jgi:AcrR family transcriptional regulator
MGMTDDEPRWRRRKTARPAEIIEAALGVFAETGFAAARLDEIARRAGVSKGALYLYFETKEDLFRAAVRAAVTPNLEGIRAAAVAFDGPFTQLAPMILAHAAQAMSDGRLGAVVKMVVGESRNFPDLARIWHDDVVAFMLDMMTGLIVRAQARGEIAPGDPRLYAFSLAGPMVMAVLYREVFGDVGTDPPNLQALAAQHARTVLNGMLKGKPG